MLAAVSLLAALFPFAGLWDVENIPLDRQVLGRETVDGVVVEEIYFTSEMVQSKPVRVYGFLACPQDTAPKRPGVLQLHGGGGTASRTGAMGLARQGQACVLSIDWSGDTKRGTRVTQAGALGNVRLFGDPRNVNEDLSDFAARHLVRALRRSIDLLASDPRIDAKRISVFGGSWGGFLSLLVAGIDPRVHSVVSGYGAGAFDGTWSYCARVMFQQGPERARFWLDTVDPLLRADRIQGPVALVSATNELHFWLNTAVKTFEKLPKGSRFILSPNTVHAVDHGVRWPTHEWLSDASEWPDVSGFTFDGKQARWKAVGAAMVERSELYVSPGRDNWPGRIWLRVPAVVSDGEYVAELPAWLRGVESDAYALITDARQRSAAALPVHANGKRTFQRPAPDLIDDFADGARLWRLLFDNRTKATMAASGDTLAVTEARGQAADIAVETNAISLVAGQMNSKRELVLDVRPAADDSELKVELMAHTGLKDERMRRVVRRLGPPEWQQIRIPLGEYEGSGPTVDWAAIDKLNLAWHSGAGQVWSFRNLRIADAQ